MFVLWNVLYKKKKIIIIKKYNFIIRENIRCDIINTTKLEVSITFKISIICDTLYTFYEEINTFIQVCIKLIKTHSKNMCIVTKDLYIK